jgi:deoxyribodipyrimidine photo-lyase
MGCISQKQLYWAMVNHEDGLHHSGSPLILELLWRDYFRFMFKKFGRQFFKPEGFREKAPLIAPDEHVVFELWKAGHTGVPFVDAAMHKLNATGYINNHCRQVVAGYLVYNLNADWTKGAAYFEEKLIDYSPASNWGNWAFIAGVGNDPKENKYFSAARAASELETTNAFIDTWLPEHDANTAAV